MRSFSCQLKLLSRSIAFVVVVAAVIHAAHANSNTEKAKQLYDDGLTSYNLGHYDEALTAFEMAYRIRHDAAFLFNIAQCQRLLRRYEDAQRSYRAYLRESPNLPTTTREQVQKLQADVEKAIEDQASKQPTTNSRPDPAVAASPTVPKPEPQTPPATEPATPVVTRAASAGRSHQYFRRVALGLLIGGLAFAAVGSGLALYSSSLYSQARSATVLGDQRDLRNRSDLVNEAGWPVIGIGCAGAVSGAVMLAISFHENRWSGEGVVRR